MEASIDLTGQTPIAIEASPICSLQDHGGQKRHKGPEGDAMCTDVPINPSVSLGFLAISEVQRFPDLCTTLPIEKKKNALTTKRM